MLELYRRERSIGPRWVRVVLLAIALAMVVASWALG